MNELLTILPGKLSTAIGWTVLHSLWQGSVAALALAILFHGLRRHSARVRYGAGVAALGLILLISVITFFSVWEPTTPVLPASTTEISPAAGGFVATHYLRGAAESYFTQHFPLIAVVWLMGVLFLLLKFMGGILLNQRLKIYRVQPAEERIRQPFERLIRLSGVRTAVRLYGSFCVKTPLTIGHFKPVLLFPVSFFSGMPADQVEALLAHELAHIARRDYLANILQHLVDILFFYHPAVRWISGLIRVEREHCCDDWAVALSGDRLNYARALTAVQESLQRIGGNDRRFGAVLAAAGHSNRLLFRIRRLLNPTRGKKTSEFSGGLIATIIFAGLFFFGLNTDVFSVDAKEKIKPPVPPKAAPEAVKPSVAPLLPVPPLRQTGPVAPDALTPMAHPLPEAPESTLLPIGAPRPDLAENADATPVLAPAPEPAELPTVAPEPDGNPDDSVPQSNHDEKKEREALKKMQERLLQMEKLLQEREKELRQKEEALKKHHKSLLQEREKAIKEHELQLKKAEELASYRKKLQDEQSRLQELQAEKLAELEKKKAELELAQAKRTEELEKTLSLQYQKMKTDHQQFTQDVERKAEQLAAEKERQEKEMLKNAGEKQALLAEKARQEQEILRQELLKQAQKREFNEQLRKTADDDRAQTDKLSAELASILKKEGVITGDDSFQILISPSSLTVNGEKQPPKILELCLKRYFEIKGEDLAETLQIVKN